MNDIHPDLDFRNFLAAGRFMIQYSPASGRHVFYPRVITPGTETADLDWVEASGKGHVYSTTVIRTRPPAEPYNVALIELAEGPRMMSRVEGIPPQDVRIGMKVRARISRIEGQDPHVVFDLDAD